MPSSASSSAKDNSASPPSEPKSLTPQRKHRKMLKDGTSEVWPESVEKFFVDGLRQYWDSPWATYSRGRSRWRNQFLVDYLRSKGIHRTKKQVASHIQVLRNMWKGEPEYQLVAGGEELFQENGLLASADPKEQSPDSVSSETSVKEERREPHSPLVPSSSGSASDFAFDPAYAASQLPSQQLPSQQLPSHGVVDYAAPSCAQNNLYLAPLTPLPSPTRVGDRSIKDEALVLASPYVFTEPSFSPHPNISTRRNCVSSLSLWAEGMQPLTVDVDRLSPSSRTSAPSPSRVCLNIKLSLAPLDALGSPTLYGFQSTVTFASPWHASAQCITRLYNADGCQQEEVGAFELLPSNLTGADQLVTALFPDSWLARCRWLTAGVQTRITQQIVVDNEDLGCIIYDLDRPLNAPPSAEFVGFNKECRARPAPISIPPSAPGALYSPATWSPHEPAPFVPRLDDASLFSTFAQPPIVEMGRRTALPRRIPLVRPVLVSRTFFRRSPCVPTAI